MPHEVSISTHVLDAGAGGPRPGVRVTVTDRAGDVVAEAVTDESGRIAGLAAGLEPSTYALTWHTGGATTVEVTVTFRLLEARHYHLPLLASDATAMSYLGV